MFYPVIEMMATFLELFFMFCIGGLFFEKRIKSKWYNLILIVLCLLDTFLITYLNNIVLYSYITLAVSVSLGALIIIALHKCNLIQSCCLAVLYLVTISAMDFLFLIFVEYVLDAPKFVLAVLTGNCAERVITLVVSKAILFIGFIVIKIKKWKISFSMLTSLILILFGVLGFLSMQYLVEKFLFSEHSETQEIVFITFAFMALFFLSVILILNGNEKIKREAKEKEFIETELKITKKKNENIIETYREIAKVSHDFKNQMRVTVSMLNNGKVSDAREFLSGIVESSVYRTKEYTGISSIDTILSEKARVAAEKAINFEYDVSLSSIGNIDPTDICTVLLNLIDNAVEACMKTDSKQERRIKLILKNVNSMVLVKTENSVDNDEVIETLNDLKTTKEDKHIHGFGLKIVKSVSEKYHGSLAVKQENKMFFSTVLLNK